MKRSILFLSIAISAFIVVLSNPVPAQELEWGFLGGLSVTRPVSSVSYSVSGVIDEYDQGQVKPFFGAYLKREIKKKWLAEAQLTVSEYAYETKIYYEDAHYLKYARELNEYKFAEFFLNNHYEILSTKGHEISLLGGFGLGVVLRSIAMHRQEFRNQGVVNTTFDFKSEESDLHFIYQVGLQYMYSFDSVSLLIRPFYKRFTEEQYVIPPKQISAFGVGVGIAL